MELHHGATVDHCGTVAELASAVGARMGLSEQERELVAWAALVHDLGKLAVPRIVLDKPAHLTDAEWELLRRHPDDGADVLESVEALAALAPAVRSSHERWDGTAYPLGLRREQIPLAARIVAACDAFEAMTANRPYCEARSWSSAIEELRGCAGSHFDPTVIVALVAELERVGEPTSYASGPPIAQGGSGPAHDHD
jgi:putative nucleotidyltransferase with HDIG domain